MYGQKFNPYGQFPSKDQLYQDEYQEEDSEPLVEEVDDSYQPTDKEVKEYAIETLGMKFPEDQGLMYLAREGLKAPLPPNWVPYQGRDGEVYYKHKITQQKTYDHPTDIEYRKKYEQMKEKAARKNLKSMNMKASAQLGLGNNSNSFVNNASNMMAPKISSSNLFGASNILSTAIEMPAVKLDSKIEEELEAELKKLQDRLRKQWKEFESEERFRSEMKEKKIKEEFEQQLENVYKGKKNQQRIEDRIKEEKAKIKQKLQAEISTGIASEVQDFVRNIEQKSREFAEIYQEDNQLKQNKYQHQKDQELSEKEKKYQETVLKINQTKEKKLIQKEAALKKLREELEGGKNKQIQLATADALQEELRKIKEDFANRIRQKEQELEREFAETKRVLGYDQNAYLSELAAKKARLKSISQQKIQSLKKKQTQALHLKYQTELQSSIQKLKQDLQSDFSRQLDDEKTRLQTRILRQKEKIDIQYRSKGQSQIQNVYEDMKYKIQGYQTEMNKKLTSIQQKFINDIHNKTKGQHPDLVQRLEAKERQMLIDNKNMMIESLKRQMELEKITYELLKLQSQLGRCKDSHSIDEKLMKYAKQHNLAYRTDKYIKYESIFKEMKEKYKKDKQFLSSVMQSLQGSRSLGVGGAAALKQYNQDVRIMRDNDEMLRKYQSLLKRAELNDKNAVEELQSGKIVYTDITMKADMGRIELSMMSSIEQQSKQQKVLKRQFSNQPQSKDIETALKDHSHFLSSMRSQLNRKLYQIRSGIHY